MFEEKFEFVWLEWVSSVGASAAAGSLALNLLSKEFWRVVCQSYIQTANSSPLQYFKTLAGENILIVLLYPGFLGTLCNASHPALCRKVVGGVVLFVTY